MTAGALYWPLSGRLEVYGAFPDDPPLAERGAADGCGDLYCTMEQRGELRTYPGRVTPADEFLTSLAERIGYSDVALMAADRYRKAEMLQVFDKLALRWPVEWRGQGWLDGAADVRDAQREILQGRPKVLESLVLESAITESAIARDPAGNPKLDRSSRRGRIDAIQATELALAASRRVRERLEAHRPVKIHYW